MDQRLHSFSGGLYNQAPNPYPLPRAQTASASTSGPSSSHSSTNSPPLVSYDPPATLKRVGGKSNVSSACGPCKRAHLACDVSRPCKRCINLGKEDLCEDVPHKKRGRPKAPKDVLGGPFSRTRPAMPGSELDQRWRQTSSGDETPVAQHFGQSYSTQPTQASLPSSSSSTFPSPPLFTIFTTTDLRILRCTSDSYPLTGYPAQDFINTNLLDWVIPHDRPLLQMEHGRLMTNPMGPGQLHTNAETQEAIAHRSDRELSSPVDGMREPYPNQNVRLMRSDQQYSLFNVRLHLGGGLGGSLWHPETSGRVYFVISLLLLPHGPPPPPPPPGPAPLQAHPAPGPHSRLSVSVGPAEPGPLSADPSRQLSYLPPSLPQAQGSRNVSGASGSSPYPPVADTPPSSAGLSSQFIHGVPAPTYYSPIPVPVAYPLAPSMTAGGSVPNYPYTSSLYPTPQSPKSDPQVYTLTQARHEREAYYEPPRSSFSAQYSQPPTPTQPTMQGYYDPRLMQAYRPPAEETSNWEGDSDGQAQTRGADDGLAYLGDAQTQAQGKGSGDAVTMGQHVQGEEMKPTRVQLQAGSGYGEFDASAWEP